MKKTFLSLLMVIALSSITIFAQSKSKIEFSAKDINNKNITDAFWNLFLLCLVKRKTNTTNKI